MSFNPATVRFESHGPAGKGLGVCVSIPQRCDLNAMGTLLDSWGDRFNPATVRFEYGPVGGSSDGAGFQSRNGAI